MGGAPAPPALVGAASESTPGVAFSVPHREEADPRLSEHEWKASYVAAPAGAQSRSGSIGTHTCTVPAHFPYQLLGWMAIR